jgi:hypothetical protein
MKKKNPKNCYPKNMSSDTDGFPASAGLDLCLTYGGSQSNVLKTIRILKGGFVPAAPALARRVAQSFV